MNTLVGIVPNPTRRARVMRDGYTLHIPRESDPAVTICGVKIPDQDELDFTHPARLCENCGSLKPLGPDGRNQ